MPRLRKKVTIAVINYNGKKFLKDNFDSIFKLDYPAIADIFLVDNCSTDGSVKFVKEKYPNVKIFQTGQNLGACFARNVAIRKTKSDLIFLIDNDVVLSPDVLSYLEHAFYTTPEAGIVSAQVRFFDHPDEIQYNGVNIHYAGGAIQNKIISDEPVSVCAVPGTAILVDCAKAIEIGLFDEDFFYGWEDGDFSFRLTISGYPSLVATNAKVYHKKAKI